MLRRVLKYYQVIVTLVILSNSLTCFGQEPRNIITEGQLLIKQRKLVEAMELLTKAIESDPAYFEAYLLRSSVNYYQKNYKEAIEDAKVVLNAPSDSVESIGYYLANLNIGTSYNTLKEYKLAIPYLRAAKEIYPQEKRVYEDIGYSYLQLKLFNLALDEFDALVKIDSTSKKGYYGKGRALYDLKQYEAAITAFDKAIELDNEYKLAYQNRGAAKYELGDKNGCCQDWQKCYELGLLEIKRHLKKVCK